MMDIQPGDVPATHADTTALEDYIGFKPETNIEDGVSDSYPGIKNIINSKLKRFLFADSGVTFLIKLIEIIFGFYLFRILNKADFGYIAIS